MLEGDSNIHGPKDVAKEPADELNDKLSDETINNDLEEVSRFFHINSGSGFFELLKNEFMYGSMKSKRSMELNSACSHFIIKLLF